MRAARVQPGKVVLGFLVVRAVVVPAKAAVLAEGERADARFSAHAELQLYVTLVLDVGGSGSDDL